MIYDTAAVWLNTHKDALQSQGLRVALLGASYTPSSAHVFLDDVSGELSGGGYARVPLTHVRVVADGVKTALRADDPVFPALTLTTQPRYLVVYAEGGGTDATRDLIRCVDLGTHAAVPTGGNYTIRLEQRALLRWE